MLGQTQADLSARTAGSGANPLLLSSQNPPVLRGCLAMWGLRTPNAREAIGALSLSHSQNLA